MGGSDPLPDGAGVPVAGSAAPTSTSTTQKIFAPKQSIAELVEELEQLDDPPSEEDEEDVAPDATEDGGGGGAPPRPSPSTTLETLKKVMDEEDHLRPRSGVTGVDRPHGSSTSGEQDTSEDQLSSTKEPSISPSQDQPSSTKEPSSTKDDSTKNIPATEAELQQLLAECDRDETVSLAKTVQTLLGLDAEVHELFGELDAQLATVRDQYDQKLKAVFRKRKEFLAKEIPLDQDCGEFSRKIREMENRSGTPQIPDFWLSVLQNSPLRRFIKEHDVSVLAHLQDITISRNAHSPDGFDLFFHFSAHNPYFDNRVLRKQIDLDSKPFSRENFCIGTGCDKIRWKKGCDKTKEPKMRPETQSAGGAQSSGDVDVRVESFFSTIFRDLGTLYVPSLSTSLERNDHPQGLTKKEVDFVYSQGGTPSEMVTSLLADHYDIAKMLRDSIVPYAIQYFSGGVEDSTSSDEEEDKESSSEVVGGEEADMLSAEEEVVSD